MKPLTILFLFCSLTVFSQYDYTPSEAYPYGKINPEAPEQTKDYEDMIGVCDCKSITKKQDGTWSEPVDMIWSWKYILNGTAVQDETLKSDGTHSGSIRQFNADSSKWYVHWYTTKTASAKFPVWEGNKKDDKIVLYKEQKAPNGMDGFYRLTFYDISKSGYSWIGEWVDTSETVTFPTWKIECKKRK